MSCRTKLELYIFILSTRKERENSSSRLSVTPLPTCLPPLLPLLHNSTESSELRHKIHILSLGEFEFLCSFFSLCPCLCFLDDSDDAYSFFFFIYTTPSQGPHQ